MIAMLEELKCRFFFSEYEKLFPAYNIKTNLQELIMKNNCTSLYLLSAIACQLAEYPDINTESILKSFFTEIFL